MMVRSVLNGRAACLAVLTVALLVSGCGRKKVKQAIPIVPRIGATELGLASWYGYPYHGRRAANGEIYDMEKMTAAHRTLPFDTWVEVTNLSNGKRVDGSHNRSRAVHRRPHHRSFARRGARHRPDRTGRLASAVDDHRTAARSRDRSQHLRGPNRRLPRQASRRSSSAPNTNRDSVPPRSCYRPGNPVVWRVLVGREPSIDAANQLLARVLEQTQPAFVVRLDEPSQPGE